MDGAIVLLVVVAIIVGIRIAMGSLDRGRVDEYVNARGGRLLDTRWEPFGPGWFGERSDRIYEVTYVDKDGNKHVTHCKTSMMTGVYFTDDRIVESSTANAAPTSIASLEDENRRLRDEVERLKRGAP